jgi:hypothetical protein
MFLASRLSISPIKSYFFPTMYYRLTEPKLILAMVLAAAHRWRLPSFGFETEADVQHQVAVQFGRGA